MFDNDFEDFFQEIDLFDMKFLKKFKSELDEILKRIEKGEIKGNWQAKEINEPNLKGFFIQGWFGTDEALEPLKPLQPLKRPPMLAKTAATQKKAVKEMREPLTDIFEENNAFKVYIELPGEEKEDITFTIKGGTLEVKAKNFYKTIKLPSDHVNADKATSQYKNGVLIITIPKTKTP